jgi:RHS repeat-associated protein
VRPVDVCSCPASSRALMAGAVRATLATTLLLLLLTVGSTAFVAVAQAASGAQESAAVQSELSHFVAGNTPVVSEQGGYGGKGAAPAIVGALVERYTTATSDTYRRPDGRMVTRVYATPVNFMDASGHWQPIASSAGANTLAEQAPGVQPLVETGWNPNCTLTSTEPKQTRCNSTEGSVGYEASSGKTNRWLWGFKLPSLGSFPHIVYAQLGVYLSHTTTTAAAAVGVYRVTDEWSSPYADWEDRKLSIPWTASGGDYSNGSDAAINPSVGSATGWIHWYPTAIVQEWYNGPSAPKGEGAAQYGLLMKDASEGSTNNTLTFNTETEGGERAPVLTFEWTNPGIGYEQGYTMLHQRLTDKMSLAVNAGSGNLQISNNDLEIAGRGLNFSAARTWNSFGSDYVEQYGEGWTGNEPTINVLPNGSVEYGDGSGAYFVFTKNGSSFTTPSGIAAYMCASGSLAPCPTTLPSGTSYQLVYDKSQTHVNFGPPSSSETSFPKSFATEIVDRYGNALKAGFTEGGEPPTSWTDTEGRKIVSELKPEVGPLKITDESGARTLHYEYESNLLKTYTDANGKKTYYRYEGNLITQITTPREELVKITYDSDARVTKIEHATFGPATTFAYYEGSEVPAACKGTAKATLVKDPDWTKEKAHETLYCSNALDQVERTIDANGNATEASYNLVGDVTTTTASAPGNGESGDVESLGYDKAGVNLLCVVTGTSEPQPPPCPSSPNKSLLVTSFSYTDGKNPFSATQAQNPEGNNQFACYNDGVQEGSKQKEIIGTECPKPSEATGPAGSLQNENDQLATEHELKFSYNTNGTIKSSTDADGHTTTYEYDEKGNLKKITPPTGSGISATTITVDADSRPHVITDGAGHIETITYDKLDRITEIAYTGTGTAKTVKFEYDADGNLIKREDPTGTTKYTVDGLNRVTKEELPGGFSNSYEYDEASNMTSFTDGGGTTKYKYNGLNELESMTEPGESKSTTFTYDNDHRLNKITYASGAKEVYQLEPTTGRPETITAEGVTGTTVPKLTYAYKEGENDASLVQTLTESTGNTTSYLYDKLNRLKEAKTTGTSQSLYRYTLDGAGNRTKQTVNPTKDEETGGQTTYYVLNGGNELECRQTVTGACSKKTSTELSGYTYDGAGEETAITPEGDTSGTTFAYNAARETSSLTPSGSSALALSYGGTGQDDLTTLGSSTTLQNSLLGITREVSSAGTSYYARTPNGLLIDQRTPSGHYNPLYDAQGDIIALVNSSGKVERTFRYGPYGENVKSEGTQTIPYPFGYKGGYRMPGGNKGEGKGEGSIANGLYHYGQRYYDPTTGRWTQQDPEDRIESATQADRFLFAGSDPINLSDPSGTESIGGFFEEVGQAAEKVVAPVAVPTVDEFEKARKCGEELGAKGNPAYEEGEYEPVQGNCDPAEYLPGGSVSEAE